MRRTRTNKKFQFVLVCLAVSLSPLAGADLAKLHPTPSKYASPNSPRWFVSSKVKADIEERHLNGGTTTNDTVRQWVQNDVGCPTNDDAGHYIANSLGGNGRIYVNIFPENRSLNRGLQRAWEGEVYGYVASGDCDKARVVVSVAFKPSENPKTRPVKVKYSVRCVGTRKPGVPAKLPDQNWRNRKPDNCP